MPLEVDHETWVRDEVGEPVPPARRTRDEESAVDVEHPDLDAAREPGLPTRCRDVYGRIIGELKAYKIHVCSVERPSLRSTCPRAPPPTTRQDSLHVDNHGRTDNSLDVMRVVIVGTDLPGRAFCEPDGTPLPDVHVALQVRQAPEGLVAGDADEARWELDVRTVADDNGQLDFRGPAVHGKRGERFLYLTWGNVSADGSFSMFRRAKLMLNRIDDEIVRGAIDDDTELAATVNLTAESGGPRCARVDPPAIAWSVT